MLLTRKFVPEALRINETYQADHRVSVVVV